MRRQDSVWWAAGFTKEWWDGLDPDDREAFLDTLSDRELESFYRDWRIWARDNQLAPEGQWTTWMLLAGRGFGKTRTGAEFMQSQVEEGLARRFALIGQGEDDIREVMIEGESGFLNIAPSWCRPVFRPSVGAGRLIWPNGAVGYLYSAADPASLRGPQFDHAWFDEPMAVPPELRKKTVDNAKMGLRLGKRPRMIYSTTPQPHRWLREEMAKIKKAGLDRKTGETLPLSMRRYVLTTGSTLDNRENLPESYLEGLLDDYAGTNLGRQELYAEILGDEEGAIWTPDMLDKQRRIEGIPDEPHARLEWLQAFARTCERVVVSVDPNMSASSKTAHAAGIMVCARRRKERFILADYSTKGGPAKWARQACVAYEDFDADEVVAEVNQGGDMVKSNIEAEARDQGLDIKVHKVRAMRGKQRRAEPVAAAYERGHIFHLGAVGTTDKPGPFYKLETQMCALHDGHDPTGEDFDRCDAAVWGLHRLGGKGSSSGSTGASAAGMFSFEEFASA